MRSSRQYIRKRALCREISGKCRRFGGGGLCPLGSNSAPSYWCPVREGQSQNRDWFFGGNILPGLRDFQQASPSLQALSPHGLVKIAAEKGLATAESPNPRPFPIE